MENYQLHVIEQLAKRGAMSQGEVRQVAQEIAGHELKTIFELDRSESDRLIVALDALVAA